ncbi:MAG: hypothetical protein CMD92_06435 [Gammaproteobacteria bacterium]|nr:hypothetical protein [Gammaproteobacteria bacterium]|tara:strand:- start:1843 stop:2649 length:807 start_codon:yes stop_codon:yes gene_type:complete
MQSSIAIEDKMMEQYKGKLQLVNTFTESRLFRTKQNQNKTNVDDAAELSFAYMMILNMFNKDYEFAPLASDYASRTVAYRNFDYFRTSGTDLYVMINRLIGKEVNDDDPRDKIALSRINLKRQEAIRYLSHIAANKSESGFEQRMLLRFQRDLNIQDGMLKSMRRLIGDWDNLSQNQKALVTTRMMQYLRRKAMRSELMPALAKFQKRGNYIVNDKKDTKKKIWDSPITKAGVAIGAIYGAGKLGKELGKTSYQTGRNLGGKFQSRGK